MNLSKLVQNQILQLIGSGELRPGDRLPSERVFCEQLEVGRSSVREAIEGLAVLGILKKSGNGIYVQDRMDNVLSAPINMLVDMQNIMLDEIIEARIATECQIVRLATVKATEDDVARLESIINRTKDSDSTEIIHVMSAEFHRALAEITQNRILINMFTVLYEQINKIRRRNYSNKITHAEILDFIKNGDADGAENAMKRHLLSIMETLKT